MSLPLNIERTRQAASSSAATRKLSNLPHGGGTLFNFLQIVSRKAIFRKVIKLSNPLMIDCMELQQKKLCCVVCSTCYEKLLSSQALSQDSYTKLITGMAVRRYSDGSVRFVQPDQNLLWRSQSYSRGSGRMLPWENFGKMELNLPISCILGVKRSNCSVVRLQKKYAESR